MNDINNIVEQLEFAQIGWVVPDIYASVKFFSKSLGIAFPEPQHSRGQDLSVSYHGKIVEAEWITSQVYNGGAYIELIQPVSGNSIFHDYLDKFPAGGVQHLAYRLPVAGFERVKSDLSKEGYAVMSTVDHPIARMVFFDTYEKLGVATEIMGITAEGWKILGEWEKK